MLTRFLFGSVFVFLGLGILYCCVINHSSLLVHIEENPIERINQLLKEEAYGEAIAYADFVIQFRNLFTDEEIAFAEKARQEAVVVRDSYWNKAKQAISGFVWGNVDDFYSALGAAAADMVVYGDLRDLAVQGYKGLTGEEVNTLIVALSIVGLGTTFALQADWGVTIIKSFVKMGEVSAGFLKRIINLFKTNKTALKEVYVAAADGAKLYKDYGLKPYAKAFRAVEHVDDVKALNAMTNTLGVPATYVATTKIGREALEASKKGKRIYFTRKQGVAFALQAGKAIAKTNLRDGVRTCLLVEWLKEHLGGFGTTLVGLFLIILGAFELKVLRPAIAFFHRLVRAWRISPTH